MRLVIPWLLALGLAAPVGAQEAVAPAVETSQDTPAVEPASLDRIREKLHATTGPHLRNLDIRADFSVHVEERRNFDDILAKLDFSTGPAPAGGLYGFELQRLQNSAMSRPLQQPYAAYSAGEFFTIAAQNLSKVYFGNKLKRGFAAVRHSAAKAEAEREVSEDIAAYCAARPDRAELQLCSPPSEP